MPSKGEYISPIQSDNSEFIGIKKIHEYKLFMKWMSIPKTLFKSGDIKKKESGFESEGLMLFSIGNQKEFAERFGLSQDTLTNWKKRASFHNGIIEETNREIFQKFYASVAYAFTQETLKHCNAARVRLWMETFGTFNSQDEELDKQEEKVGVDVTADEIAALVAYRIKKNRDIDMDEVEKKFEKQQGFNLKEQEYDWDEILSELNIKKEKVEAC